MSANLKIDLYPDLDRNGRQYFIGKLKSPVNINCKDGIVLLVFTAENGSEQIQIAAMDQKDDRSKK